MHDYLDEHQIKAVEALFELQRICDKHGIRFYLLAGTTLGAVRHEGMIPWDDDVDVGFLVEDLIKLQAVIKDELNPELGFEYASLEVEHNFPRLFGKILYNRQSCVDLFVIAKWTNNDFRGNIHWNITRFCVESYYRSIGYKKPTVAARASKDTPSIQNTGAAAQEQAASESEAAVCEQPAAESEAAVCEQPAAASEEDVDDDPDSDEYVAVLPDTSAPDFEADADIYAAVPSDPVLEALETETEANSQDEAPEADDAEIAAAAVNPPQTAKRVSLYKRFKRAVKTEFNLQPTRYAKKMASQKKTIRQYRKNLRIAEKKFNNAQKKLHSAQEALRNAEKKMRKLKLLNRKAQLQALFKAKNMRKALRFIAYKCCFFLKTEDYVRLARWNEDFFGRHGYDCYANIYSIYGMKKERIKKEWIENTSYVTFEGRQFLTVGDTDAYLTHLYGNYMQLPPEEKRVRARHAEVYARNK